MICHLEVNASMPGATAESFAKLAKDAKTGCLMSRLLKRAVTMGAKLVNGNYQLTGEKEI